VYYRCAHRVELGERLTSAIQFVYRLHADSQAAPPGSATQDALLNVLQKAREDQRHAEKAFLDHVKVHNCAEHSFAAR
jgi:hypothetical protein